MKNTALRAGNSNSRAITFKNKKHEKFYTEYLEKCRYQDVDHQALVYCLGIDRDTRENVNKIYRGSGSLINTLFSSDYEVFGAFFYEKNEMAKYRQKPLKTI